MYVVYAHTNKLNGKKYIGMTNNVKRRWRQKGSEYKSATKFYEAILKYGWDNFTHEILERDLSESDARKREIYYIALYDTQNELKGYNTDKGGRGGKIYKEHPRNMLGRNQTPYQKRKQRTLMSDESFNPMTNGSVVWGETHEHPKGMLGKKHDDETKSSIAKTMVSKNVNCKSIKVIYPQGFEKSYRSIGEASSDLSISSPTIKKYLDSGKPYEIKVINQYTKKNKHLVGVRFEYIKDNTEVTQETKAS